MLTGQISEYLFEKLNLEIKTSNSVSGGSINQAYRIETQKKSYFLKVNPDTPDDFFEKEADGLNRLRKASTDLRIPEVIATGEPEGSCPGFLLIEWIEQSHRGNSFTFGQGLANLHKANGDFFGLENDNYIGSLPQLNGQYRNWDSFFAEKRIEPQLKLAFDNKKLNRTIVSNWQRLSNKLQELLPPCKPSLLHGDLWSGNYLFDNTGTAVLIDPAVYYGHPEMDLAFTKMFGGFSEEFYRGYESITPLDPGFSDRVPIYNLYPLLVHVNLFGGHYISQFQNFIRLY